MLKKSNKETMAEFIGFAMTRFANAYEKSE